MPYFDITAEPQHLPLYRGRHSNLGRLATLYDHIVSVSCCLAMLCTVLETNQIKSKLGITGHAHC